MIKAFRICRTRTLENAFSGEGARLHGGRWNSIGTPVVYAAGNLSLATLEVMAHLADYRVLKDRYSWVEVRFRESMIEEIEPSALRPHWDAEEPSPATMSVGDTWIRESRTAVLKVPSSITPGEYNFLLNPVHQEFKQVKIGPIVPFQLDPRLAMG